MRNEWYDDIPIIDIGDVANPNTKIKVQILESKQTQFAELKIGFNPELGNIMFLNGEIQISESDYIHYHSFIMGALDLLELDWDTKLNILIIGDGDGGFTKFGHVVDIDIVERDKDVTEAGTKYFGAEWDKVNLIISSVEDFNPEKQYDGIVDSALSGSILGDQLDRIWSWLKPGGRFIGPTTMITDSSFLETFLIYENWCLVNNIEHMWLNTYIDSYFSNQNFFIGIK